MGSKFKDINLGLFITSIVFGFSSWVVFSGIWVESPLLVQKLPEGWKISSMISAVSQLAQIGPILLFFMKCKCISCIKTNWSKRLQERQVSDRVIVYGLFIIGLAAGACLSLFWDYTLLIYGQQRSIAFFICVFCLALLDCTCTIVFLTYIGLFKGNYTTGLYIGEGISSLLPSLFSLMQGVSEEKKCNSTQSLNSTNLIPLNITIANANLKEPRFGVTTYFWLLFLTLVISFMAFLMLEWFPTFRKEKIDYQSLRYNQANEENYESRHNEVDPKVKTYSKKGPVDKFLLLTSITTVSFLIYGFIPGLNSYSAAPYGYSIMHLCTTLSLITQPFSALLAFFVQIKSTRYIILLLFLSLLICSYITAFSYLSPCPPFKNEWYGGSLMVTAWVSSFGLLMYLRCVITSSIKRNHGEDSLFWCALLTQVGQFIGSTLNYVLVDLVNFFQEADECSFGANVCIK